ncbi:hypothetical protein ABR738_21575 [Streptomyces sp. Edi4]|uniref:hypothetical protein n=1 Tax=Streptomyces sp. Edi4 TaxID=3162527 RepID=UPI0033063001
MPCSPPPTPAEFTAANDQIRLQDEWARELDKMKEDFADLLMKYSAQLPKGSVVSDAIEIMTAEHYAEFERLLPIVTAQDTFEYRALHRQD